MRKSFSKIKSRQFLVYLVFIIIAIAQSYNMFNYPSYFDDEGTYMSQAWSVLKQGKLAPYTYWYDHSPIGWLAIAGWVFITGGFDTFGVTVNSGRVFMLVIHLLSTFFLFKISKKLTNNFFVSILVILIFSFSPLAITLHRMVFLDNIAVLFFLAAFYLFILKRSNLLNISLSAVFFALAVLTKEAFPVFIPGFLYLLFINKKENKTVAAVSWISILGMVISLYALYALLKGEFFPAGSLLGGNNDHVSLLDTLAWQAGRKGGFFLNDDSMFMYTLKRSWLVTDPSILIAGFVAGILNLLFSRKKTVLITVNLFFFGYIYYLIRGGIVNDQYIIPLFPLFALNIGIFLSHLSKFLQKYSKAYLPIVRHVPSILVLIMFSYFFSKNPGVYTLNQTKNQIEALVWTNKNVGDNEIVVVDAYGLADLFETGSIDIATVKGPQHYWKVDADPQVRLKLLNNDWKNIKYLIATHKLRSDLALGEFPLIDSFLRNSQKVETFANDYYRLDNPTEGFPASLLLANGEKVEVYKRNDLEDIYLSESWTSFKNKFISEGQTIDPSTQMTTSEGQANAMLISIWMNDKETFDQLWSWTKNHLQFRGDMLLSSKWSENERSESLVESNSSTGADQDIALALIFASRKWQNPIYILDSLSILRDMWEKEIVSIEGRYLITSSPENETEEGYLINNSHFSPASYRVFSEIDTTHDWEKVATDSYYFLELIKDNLSPKIGLMPNWVILNESGKVLTARNYIDSNADYYGYDAYKLFWRIALDNKWFPGEESKNFTHDTAQFFMEKIKNDSFLSIYNMEGEAVSDIKSISTLTGPLSVFTIENTEMAGQIFNDFYVEYFNNQKDKNFQDLSWSWFSMALYTNKLPNLSHIPDDEKKLSKISQTSNL